MRHACNAPRLQRVTLATHHTCNSSHLQLITLATHHTCNSSHLQLITLDTIAAVITVNDFYYSGLRTSNAVNTPGPVATGSLASNR